MGIVAKYSFSTLCNCSEYCTNSKYLWKQVGTQREDGCLVLLGNGTLLCKSLWSSHYIRGRIWQVNLSFLYLSASASQILPTLQGTVSLLHRWWHNPQTLVASDALQGTKCKRCREAFSRVSNCVMRVDAVSMLIINPGDRGPVCSLIHMFLCEFVICGAPKVTTSRKLPSLRGHLTESSTWNLSLP